MKIINIEGEFKEMYNLKLEKAERGCFSCDSFHPLMTCRTLSRVIVSIWCLAVCVVDSYFRAIMLQRVILNLVIISSFLLYLCS